MPGTITGDDALTIDEAREIAARVDARQELIDAAADEQAFQASVAAQFRHLSASDVLRLWQSGRNEQGKKLSRVEIMALGEQWSALTGQQLPDLGNGSPSPQPAPATPPVPAPADDTMLRVGEVLRMTSLSLSTLKRYVQGIGDTFPPPVKLSARRIGWKAGDVKAWLAEREAASVYQHRGRLH
jgi:predicted DNA-binding transcriptional regulator AlpA